MFLLLLAYLGGALTILSPCILPVLPFVFARAGQPFLKSGLPLLLGMAVTFAGIATLAAVGGAWAVRINQYGRVAALVLLAAFAATLLSRRLADWLTRPVVALGNRLSQSSLASAGTINSLLLGAATGLLWAPCAGPILGLVLTGAAISGPNTQTTLLLLAYALGAATSLALATLAGGRIFAALKQSLGVGEWLRRGLGVAVLLGVVAIAFGWDTGLLTRLSLANTSQWEQALIDAVHPADEGGAMMAGGSMKGNAMMGGAMMAADGSMAGDGMTADSAMMSGNAMMSAAASQGLPVEGEMPALSGATEWLNSAPLNAQSLRGKVVLIDFWTYSCINCLRALPYVKAWQQKYEKYGLVVIGVHAPEFAFEKDPDNVRRAIKDLGIAYPVALDNDYAIWQAFNNRYWPAHYFVDAGGRIRAHHFGEGNYDESERIIRRLLLEAGAHDLPADTAVAATAATGVQAAADQANMQSPETYIGYERAEHFAAGDFAPDRAKNYATPARLALNQWGLDGNWAVDKEKAVLAGAPGKIVFRFFARDLHLVLNAGRDGKPIRFRVLLDGAPPAQSRGMDIDANGNGVVREQRLYQLIRQAGEVREHTFSIEFLDDGVQAYAFTFG